MNFVLQNITRRAVGAGKKLVSCRAYSTAVHVTESQASEEPDKLYKKIEVELRANESETIKSYVKFATMAAKHLGINIGKCYAPFKPVHDREGLCLLRAAFAHKDCRVHYEVRTYFWYMNFHRLTGSTADTFLEYIERNLPEGVAMKITKVAVEKLPEEVTAPSEQSNEDKSGNVSSVNINE